MHDFGTRHRWHRLRRNQELQIGVISYLINASSDAQRSGLVRVMVDTVLNLSLTLLARNTNTVGVHIEGPVLVSSRTTLSWTKPNTNYSFTRNLIQSLEVAPLQFLRNFLLAPMAS